MPKISAIICEYNPMHAGHMLHIAKTRRLTSCDYVVCIMSGSFTQRGEPAVFDKFSRARAALCGGADMVIELPTLFSCASAEKFAMGGVFLADSSNIVDHLSFGCENADISLLDKTAHLLCDQPDTFRSSLKNHLDSGMSFPRARERAVCSILPEAEGVLSSPNNILAIEYLKALIRLKSKISPVAVKREGSAYLEKQLLDVPSALALREALKKDENLNSLIPSEINTYSRPAVFCDALFLPAMLKLRTMSVSQLDEIEGVSEGLSYRLKDASKYAESYDELLFLIKSKRYPLSRLRRILLNIILDIKKDAPALPSYIRVLGVKKSARPLLTLLSSNSSLPVVVSPVGICDPELARDIAASDIRALLESPSAPACEDFTHGLIVI